MRALDMFWMSNRDWWEFVDHIPTIKASAPPEAQRSYKRYMEQTSNKAEYRRLMERIEEQKQIIAENKAWFGEDARERRWARRCLADYKKHLKTEFPNGEPND